MEKKWLVQTKIIPPKSIEACGLIRFIFYFIDGLFHLYQLSKWHKGVLIRVQARDDQEAEKIEKIIINLLVKHNDQIKK